MNPPPAYWSGADDPALALPDGAEPLSAHVQAPDVLRARLSQIGVVDEAGGDRLAGALKPGQRLVTREGALWRWDGLRIQAGAASAAERRLAARAARDKAVQDRADAERTKDTAQTEWNAAREALRAAIAARDEARNAQPQAEAAARAASEKLAGLERDRARADAARTAARDARARLDAQLKDERAGLEAARAEREALDAGRPPMQLVGDLVDVDAADRDGERDRVEPAAAAGVAGDLPHELLVALPCGLGVRVGITTLDPRDDTLEGGLVATEAPEAVKPSQATEFGMYIDGQWYRLNIKPELVPDDPVASLDVSLLADNLIEPILGISDPRTDNRIDFVGGIRGLGELEKRVNSGEMAIAFSFFPTSMEALMAVADAGKVMPPKSTWFEPKLRSGLIVRPLSE